MANGIPAQHSEYIGEMQTLFAEINSITDNATTQTYTNPDDMIQALQKLHISELLGFEKDGAYENGRNGGTKDYTMGGSETLQEAPSALIDEFRYF